MGGQVRLNEVCMQANSESSLTWPSIQNIPVRITCSYDDNEQTRVTFSLKKQVCTSQNHTHLILKPIFNTPPSTDTEKHDYVVKI